jgi:hypothetical protein
MAFNQKRIISFCIFQFVIFKKKSESVLELYGFHVDSKVEQESVLCKSTFKLGHLSHCMLIFLPGYFQFY